MGEKTDEPNERFGITDEDRVRIERYLRKEKHERSVDDLRPSAEK